jgi:hypothetical protein
VWTFSRSDRLGALVDRTLAQLEYLQRERCDCYLTPDRLRAVDRRLYLTRERLQALRVSLRSAKLHENQHRRRQLAGTA